MKALTRKEMLMNAFVNGTLDEYKPFTREELFMIEAMKNSGGGVTSWNDLTDRPFGEEVAENVIFEKQVVTFETGSRGLAFKRYEMQSNPFIVGNVCSVEWDGIEYELVAKESHETDFEMFYIGNSKYSDTTSFDDGDNTPFCIYWESTYGGRIQFAYGETPDYDKDWGEVEIGVYTEETTITPLDPKYLPVMTVNVNVDAEVYDAGSCDKSFAEIKAHLDAGGSVDMTIHRGTSLSVKMHYVSCTDTSVNFSALEVSLNGSSTPNYYYVWGLTIGNVGENDIIWYCRHKVTDTTL